ncbi:MAG: hypothetical protein Q9163_006004, partial [Psora crenata]
MELKLSAGYQGIILKGGGKKHSRNREHLREALGLEENGDIGDLRKLKTLQEVGSFDQIILWGHERLVGEDDAFVRGVDEWIEFAEAVRFLSSNSSVKSPQKRETYASFRFTDLKTRETKAKTRRSLAGSLHLRL